MSVSGRLAAFSGVFALATLVISLMMRGRMQFPDPRLRRMLPGLLWSPRWRRYLRLVVVEILAVVMLFRFMPAAQNRFVNQFIEHLPTDAGSRYAKAMLTGVEAFYSALVFGIGPANFGKMCFDIVAGRGG